MVAKEILEMAEKTSYSLKPLVPTPDMLSAGRRASSFRLSPEEVLEIYLAMNSVAPHASPSYLLPEDQVNLHLDAILRASGSALKHYTMHKTRSDMQSALRSAVASALKSAI